MTSRDSAAEYLVRGWAPIPVPWQKKAPSITGWQKLRVTPETLGAHFNGVRQNVGLLLGDASCGLVDIDLDCPEAVIAARHLLPDTGCVFGRSGNPASHLLFLASCRTRKFAGPEGNVLVELRSTGCQTIVPPSAHPSGEAIEWFCDNGAAEVDGGRLAHLVGLVAAAALIARHWPAHGRHDAALALAGALRHSGWSLEQTEIFVRAVVEAAGDEEATDRLRAARDTYTKGTPTTGWPRLAEMMGDPIIDRLRDWLGVRAQTGQTSLGHGENGATSVLGDQLDEYSGVPATRDSEAGIAQAFTRQHGHDWRYVAAWGKWLWWSGQQWLIEPTLRVQDLIREICLETAASVGTPSIKTRLSSARTVGGADHLARMHRRHAATVEQWDADLWEVNTMGGVVALSTGDIRPPRREDYMTKMMTATPRGDCPRWKAFLVEICGGDMELVAYLQRALGYSLTGTTTEHVLIFLWGTGANGKSVFMTVVTGIFADYAATAPLDTFMETRTDKHPTDVAGFRGARLVACTETEQGRRWAESKIKTLTGGDKVSARFMRQDFFTYTPQFKLWIAGNHKPYIRNVDEAMKRRVHLVPFTVTVPYERRDKRLASKLLEERDGILAWMVEGCLEWQRIGLAPPKAVLDATEEYFQEEDAVGQFLQEECATRKGAKTPVAEVFDRWRKRAEARGEHAATSRWLVRQLAARGFWATKGAKGVQVLEGLVLLVDSSAYNDT